MRVYIMCTFQLLLEFYDNLLQIDLENILFKNQIDEWTLTSQ